jgi:hypothetical protein
MPKLIKNKCEIEGCTCVDPSCLELHHIINRTEKGCSNKPWNLAILCANHHSQVHSGKIKLLGIIPSTLLPNKRTLIYEIDGIPNVATDGIIFPVANLRPSAMKIGN